MRPPRDPDDVDLAAVRHALHGAPAGHDLAEAQRAFERLLARRRRVSRDDEPTVEQPLPRSPQR